MVLYKSLCRDIKTFHGVTFHFGEVKAVNGYIHDRRFICVGKSPLESKAKTEETVIETEPMKIAEVQPKAKKVKQQVEKRAELKSTAKVETQEDSKKQNKKKSGSRSQVKSSWTESIEENTSTDKKTEKT